MWLAYSRNKFFRVGPNILEKFVPGGTNLRRVQIKCDSTVHVHISSSSYHSNRNMYAPGWWTVSMAHWEPLPGRETQFWGTLTSRTGRRDGGQCLCLSWLACRSGRVYLQLCRVDASFLRSNVCERWGGEGGDVEEWGDEGWGMGRTGRKGGRVGGESESESERERERKREDKQSIS